MFESLYFLFLFCFHLPSFTSGQGFGTPQRVHQISGGPSLKYEKLAVRSNNQILATVSSPHARLYQISPTDAYPPILVASFPDVSGAYGVHEVGPDKFYVATSNSTVKKSVPKSNHIFEVDMTHFQASSPAKHPAKISKVVSLPQAHFIQGVTAAPSSTPILLIADGLKGCVWRYNLKTPKVAPSIAIENINSNSIDVHQDPHELGSPGMYLWYTNTGTSTLYRVRVGSDGGTDGSPTEAIMMEPAGNGFAISSNGNMYVASYANNEVYYVSDGWWNQDTENNQPADTQVVNKGGLIGPTSVAFGKGSTWGQTIFVTTSGGPNGKNGEVGRIDVSSFEVSS